MADIEHRQAIYRGGLGAHPDRRWHGSRIVPCA